MVAGYFRLRNQMLSPQHPSAEIMRLENILLRNFAICVFVVGKILLQEYFEVRKVSHSN